MKILIVDGTIFYRKILKDVFAEIYGVEVVGTAQNGKVALEKINNLKPGLVTLDVEMPYMNGLETLQIIQKEKLDVDVIMVSSKTQRGSDIAIQALTFGAFDFIPKPNVSDHDENKRVLKREIMSKLLILKHKKRLYPSKKPNIKVLEQTKIKTPPSMNNIKKVKRTKKSQIIAIGSSTGGPNALNELLTKLPDNIGVPIVVTQHMPPVFTASLARTLNNKSKLTVKEACDGDVLENNVVYIAAGGKQMKVASGAKFQKMIRLTDDPPENSCRPAVDYLFRSVAREYGSKVTGVVLTGMGSDGKIGMSVMKAAGAVCIVQNAETSVVYGMPKAVIEAGLADFILPIEKISEQIMKTV